MFNFNYFPSPKIAFSVSCFMCIDAWIMAEASSYVVYADITVFYVQRGWFSIFGFDDICSVLALPALPSMPSWPAAPVDQNRTQLTCILLGWCAGILKSNTGVWINLQRPGNPQVFLCSSDTADAEYKKITQSTCSIVKRRAVLCMMSVSALLLLVIASFVHGQSPQPVQKAKVRNQKSYPAKT